MDSTYPQDLLRRLRNSQIGPRSRRIACVTVALEQAAQQFSGEHLSNAALQAWQTKAPNGRLVITARGIHAWCRTAGKEYARIHIVSPPLGCESICWT